MKRSTNWPKSSEKKRTPPNEGRRVDPQSIKATVPARQAAKSDPPPSDRSDSEQDFQDVLPVIDATVFEKLIPKIDTTIFKNLIPKIDTNIFGTSAFDNIVPLIDTTAFEKLIDTTAMDNIFPAIDTTVFEKLIPKIDTAVFDTAAFKNVFPIIDTTVFSKLVSTSAFDDIFPLIDASVFEKLIPQIDTTAFKRLIPEVDPGLLDQLVKGVDPEWLDQLAETQGDSTDAWDELPLETKRRLVTILLPILLVAFFSREVATVSAHIASALWTLWKFQSQLANESPAGELAVDVAKLAFMTALARSFRADTAT